MAKKGFSGSWFAGSHGPANPHAHSKGKITLRPGMERAKKAWQKRKLEDPKAWEPQPAKAGSPPTLWAPCTKPTRDPIKGPKRDDD
jgi:hypothetical protein